MSTTRLAPAGRHDRSLGITDEEFDHDRAGVLARLRAEGDLDFGPAVLDPAHIGDIRGSLGTISLRDRAARRTWWRRLVTFAAILGPGIIVMTGDNDADEAHIRTLLVRELTRDDFVLHSVQSHDLNSGSGLVEVTAELQRRGRDDLALEAAVSRLSLEPVVSSVTWTTTEPSPLSILEE